VLSLDNHYVIGGQGEVLSRSMVQWGGQHARVQHLGLQEIPPSGTNPEVISRIRLDTSAIVDIIEKELNR
jgi:transketolase